MFATYLGKTLRCDIELAAVAGDDGQVFTATVDGVSIHGSINFRGGGTWWTLRASGVEFKTLADIGQELERASKVPF